jgi:hypothetical protein
MTKRRGLPHTLRLALARASDRQGEEGAAAGNQPDAA